MSTARSVRRRGMELSGSRRVLRRHTLHIGWLLAVGALGGCGSDPTQPPTGTPPEVNQYLQALPAWATFSPPQSAQPPAPSGPAQALPDQVLDVRQIENDGTVTLIPDVTYSCSSTPYTMRDNPREIVIYSPDIEILWPGSLIQGRSHRDGQGSLLGLTIRERTPIRVSIPSLPTQDNFREVSNPDQATVASAIGSMVGNATRDGLATPSSIQFEQRTYHSESEFALSIGLSGRYMGFEGSATGDLSRNASETTITANFVQKMFEVVVAPPQTPGAFFSSEFTPAKLQEQITLGRIGPDNIPVYLSSVVYGRMMAFSLTSTASAEDMRGTISAAYNGIGGGGSGSLNVKQRRILQESKIAVSSLGGNAEATLAVIRSGDWTQYFTNVAPLSSAAPLSYTFRNLGDGSIASVTEATTFNIKQCTPRPTSPGTFDFLALQNHMPVVPAPFRTLVGDVNGDRRADFIWNHAGVAGNQVYVGLALGDGTFMFTPAVAHPESPAEGWANYESFVGDVDGDRRDDLIWNHTGTQNKTYVGLSNGDGTFAFPSVRTHPSSGWTPYKTLVGDVNRDDRIDLIWNYTANLTNRVYVGPSLGNSTFRFPRFQDLGIGIDWTPYATLVGDVDGDRDTDLLWNRLQGSANITYVGRSDGDTLFALGAALSNTRVANWAGFERLVGDVDGDGAADLIWADTATNTNAIAVGRATGGGLTFLAVQPANYSAGVPLRVRTGDTNGDGRADLVWNTTGTVNHTFVSLGKADAAFDLSPQMQLHSAIVDWDQFALYVADVNGDRRDDAIWVHPAATTRMYVGLARP